MLRRALFFGLLGFWLVMNYLLWRHEVVGFDLGSPIEPEIVFQKILEAPDDSSMRIRHREKSLGYARLVPQIAEETGNISPGDFQLEGLVNERSGYVLDLEGRLLVQGLPNQFRYNFTLNLDSESNWISSNLQMGVGENFVDVFFSATNDVVQVNLDTKDQGRQTWNISPSNAGNLETLISRLNPMTAGLLEEAKTMIADVAAEDTPLKWEAWSGSLDVGHAKMRVYRLRTRLLGRYDVTVTVSRVGEILLVDLPNDLQLVNEVIGN